MADISFIGEINEWSATDFVAKIDAIPARASRSMFLATPGGDVFSGGAMIIAMEHAIERGVNFTIELGSIVASMGAAMAVAAKARKCRVVVHANTEVMFHGCYTVVAGGASIMKDEAKGLEDFNKCVRRDLEACGVKDTEEWFAEGREMWLNADELVQMGIADEIISRPAGVDENARGVAMRFAAMLNHKENPTMDEPTQEVKPEETPAVEPTPAPEAQPAEEQKPEAAQEQPKPEEAKPADMVARADFQAMQSLKDKKISDLMKEAEDLNARLAAVTAARDNLQKELADLRDNSQKAIDEAVVKAKAELQAIHNEVVAPALAHTEPTPMTAEEIGKAKMSALDKCNALLKR